MSIGHNAIDPFLIRNPLSIYLFICEFMASRPGHEFYRSASYRIVHTHKKGGYPDNANADILIRNKVNRGGNDILICYPARRFGLLGLGVYGGCVCCRYRWRWRDLVERLYAVRED